MTQKIKPEEIFKILDDYIVEGKYDDITITNAKSIDAANENSIVWLKSVSEDGEKIANRTNAKIIVCDKNIEFSNKKKCFIKVNNPKLVFTRILNHFFGNKNIEWRVHPTALIHPEAKLPKKVYIGPYSIIGKSIIGEESIIHEHSIIKDDVTIGKHVTIHSHSLIGSDGFGYIRNKKNELEKFTHIGKVVIEDNVDIFPYVNVDKGALFETRIKKGAKIDHYCHIGHNTITGENSVITAGTVLCGGSVVGDRCWIGVGSIVKEKIKIGNDVFIGLGTVVTKDIPDKSTWVGTPGRPIKSFIKLQKELKNLIDQ